MVLHHHAPKFHSLNSHKTPLHRLLLHLEDFLHDLLLLDEERADDAVTDDAGGEVATVGAGHRLGPEGHGVELVGADGLELYLYEWVS